MTRCLMSGFWEVQGLFGGHSGEQGKQQEEKEEKTQQDIG